VRALIDGLWRTSPAARVGDGMVSATGRGHLSTSERPTKGARQMSRVDAPCGNPRWPGEGQSTEGFLRQPKMMGSIKITSSASSTRTVSRR
jgi:hypothetical protein